MSARPFTPLSELEASFQRLSSEYHSRKAEAEAAAVTWEWASAPRHDPRPFYYEREGVKPGRKLRRPGLFQYGFDSGGAVVVELQATDFPGQIYENFYRYAGDRVEVARYDYWRAKEPIACSRLTYAGGRLDLYESRGTHGITRERYVWNGITLDRIEVLHSPVTPGEPPKEPKPWQVVELSHDARGTITSIQVRQMPEPPRFPEEVVEVVYRRPRK